VGNYFPANGRFYTMGGRSSDTAGNDLTHPFEYNPATNTWVTKAATFPDINVNNMACGVLTVGGTPQIYCVGGSAGGGTTATARVFSYNPVTDTITTLTAADNWPGDAVGTILPGGFAVVANKLYIVGGFNIGTASTAQTWQFDPTAAVGARWLRTGLPMARYISRSGLADNLHRRRRLLQQLRHPREGLQHLLQVRLVLQHLESDRKYTESDRRDAGDCHQ
jgi:hypothetical protein